MATATKPRTSRLIQDPKDLEEIFSLSSYEAARRSTIMKYFADFGKGPRFYTYDLIEVPKGVYGKTKKNKNAFLSTVGLYIYNKGSLEDLSDIVGYVNETITKKVYNKINKKISYAVTEDKVTVQQLKDWIIQSQIYMACTSALSPSHTMKLLLLTNEIEKKKKELVKKYAEGIKNKDVKEIDAMEKELLAFALDYMGDDPAMEIYNSGATSSIGNNFKNMYVMKGAVKLSDSTYDVILSSYIDGYKREDFVANNDSGVGGPYSRAVMTQDGGYLEKQFIAAYQHLYSLKPGSDCGTTKTITVTLTEDNIDDWLYSFVKTGSTYTEITSDNMKSFIGKTVNMRFSSLCKSKNGMCEKCVSARYNRLGITNMGLTVDIIASKIKNIAMKKFHNSTLNMHEMDLNKVFGE